MSQLSGVLSSEKLSPDLSGTLLKIIARSQEASYRWKCMEILMRDPITRDTQLRRVPEAVAQRNPNMTKEAKSQLQAEIKVIYELLNEEDGVSLTPRSSVAGPQAVAVEGELSPSEWIENCQDSFTIEAPAIKSSISVRANCHKAGLSPDGAYAYFIAKKDFYLYRLLGITSTRSDDLVLHHGITKSESGSEYKEAALSNSFLAVLKESQTDSLEVYKYGWHPQTCSSKAVEPFEATSNEARWRADCLAIYESRDRVWIAVGGRSSQSNTISSTIRMYTIDIDGKKISKHDAYFHRTRPNPFTLDHVKSIAFGMNGRRLSCVTNNNRILVWLLSNNARPIQSPFQIAKTYMPEMNAQGVTSASLFQTASLKPYILCTTSPSTERSRNDGEWSYVSPIGPGPIKVPPQLDHNLWRLGKAKAIIAGATSLDGTVIALLEETGRILLMSLVAEDGGGLSSQDPICLDKQLKSRKKVSPTALRFCEVDRRLCLVAVDPQGIVIRQYFQDSISR